VRPSLLNCSCTHISLEVHAITVTHFAVKVFITFEILNLKVLKASPYIFKTIEFAL